MNIEGMSMSDVETRCAEIEAEINAEGADIDALTAEVEKLEQRKAQIAAEAQERESKMKEVESSRTIEDFQGEEKNMEKELRSKLVDALAETIKGRANEEQRALLSTYADPAGTVMLSSVIDQYIWTDWEKSPILSRVRKSFVKGVYAVQYEAEATGAVIHGEGAAAPAEEELVLGMVQFMPQYFKKWITVSDTVMALRGEEFLRYLHDEFGHQIALAVENYIVNELKTSELTAQIPHAYDGDAVLTAFAALSDEAQNPVVITTKQIYAQIKALRTTTGSRLEDPFEGMEVLFNNTVNGILVGDLGGVIANFPEGEEFKYIVDDKSLAERDLVKIVGKLMGDAHLVRPRGFAYITASFSGGTGSQS